MSNHVIYYILLSLLAPLAHAMLPAESDTCSRLLIQGMVVPEVFVSKVPRKEISVRSNGKWLSLERGVRSEQRTDLISVLIPVYRELDSGNIHRIIQMLAGQEAWGPARLQLVLVVNNNHYVGERRGDPVRDENKRTVEWLKALKNKVPFIIDVVDETDGFERNMGKLRNRALFRALQITNVAPRHHVIVNFDADGTWPKNYLSSLVDYYDHYAVDAVITRRTHTIPNDATLDFFKSHYASMHSHLLFDLENAIGYPYAGYSTPQITLRADAALKLNGFSPMIENEDLDLGLRLLPFKVVQVPDIMVTQSDRAREDGFDSVRRLRMMEEARKHPSYRDLGELFQNALISHAKSIESEIDQGKTDWQSGLEQMLKQARRATTGYWPKGFELYADNPEGRLSHFLEWKSKSNSDQIFPVMLYMLHDAIVFQELEHSTTLANFLTTYIANGLTAGERRRFKDQWLWRQRKAEQLVNERIADLRALVRGDLPVGSANAFSDPFRRHLRMNVPDGLRFGLMRWIQEPVRRQMPAEKQLEALRELFPDWLKFEVLEYSYEVENIRFLIDWILNSSLDQERNRQTVRAFQVKD